MALFFLMTMKLPLLCPGFAVEVVDKIGSGDALLALLSVCLILVIWMKTYLYLSLHLQLRNQ